LSTDGRSPNRGRSRPPVARVPGVSQPAFLAARMRWRQHCPPARVRGVVL
jgi:hypothetical protein